MNIKNLIKRCAWKIFQNNFLKCEWFEGSQYFSLQNRPRGQEGTAKTTSSILIHVYIPTNRVATRSFYNLPQNPRIRSNVNTRNALISKTPKFITLVASAFCRRPCNPKTTKKKKKIKYKENNQLFHFFDWISVFWSLRRRCERWRWWGHRWRWRLTAWKMRWIGGTELMNRLPGKTDLSTFLLLFTESSPALLL